MASQSEEQKREEAKTIEALMNAVNLDDNTMAAIKNARSNEEYAAEKSLFPSAWDVGLPQGMAAGLASLAFFTVGNSILMKRSTSPGGPFAFRAVALSVLTFAVSMANATIVAEACQDKEKVLSRLAEIPLTSGRSVVSDSFCQDLSQEYRRLHSPEYYKTVQSPLLRYMGVFVHNCELRQAYERQLLQEQGMTMNQGESVFIPPPGVPTTTSVSDDGSDYNTSDLSQPGDFDFGQEETIIGDDWADTFTTDEEDSTGSTSSSKDWK